MYQFWIHHVRAPNMKDNTDNNIHRCYDMKVRSQMQGGKNWMLPKEINAHRFFGDAHWLKIWKKHLCSSMGDRAEGAWLWTHVKRACKKNPALSAMPRP
jgi:hypothetical protein